MRSYGDRWLAVVLVVVVALAAATGGDRGPVSPEGAQASPGVYATPLP